MLDTRTKHTFGELFKLFRLRAGIETLSSFANMMAEHGMVYENSLYSRWQRNERIPRDRKVVLLVAKILNEHKGIASKDEVNLLLESVDQRELTEEELHQFQFDELVTHTLKPTTTTSEKTTHILTTLKRSLLSTKITYLILAMFIVQTAMFSWVWNEQLYGTFQAYFVGYTYGYIALVGISYGMLQLKKQISSPLGTTVKWLCFGLLSQFVGLQIWTAYNLQGIDVPYPSLADLGYFGLIPCYLYAALSLTHADWVKKNIAASRKNAIIFLSPPFFMMTALMVYFSLTRGFSIQPYMSDILAILFPVGEIIPMTILLYSFILGSRSKSQMTKYLMGFVLFGFFLQFLAEYSFIFSASLGAYVNTNAIDYIYCISYTYMALTIVMLTNVNKLYNPNTALEEATSSKHNPNSSRLLSSYNPIQN